jgi:hypothetical protein
VEPDQQGKHKKEDPMIELGGDSLCISFPEIHDEAKLTIDFQRTLRIPDDDKVYPLPAGLGNFPLRHVDDFASRVPATWLAHGGVMLPLYQSEALWIHFGGRYPMAIKIAAGKVNAVTGKSWSNSLHRGPQDYLVTPEQPWLDGYCVEKGIIRQFVAMPLGSGYSAEEQITGKAEHGGLQVLVYPMKREVYEKKVARRARVTGAGLFLGKATLSFMVAESASMGLAPGGRMRQEIYDDPFELADWDATHSARCFVHLANSLVWRGITGQAPPTTPPTADEYRRQGIPWFDYYSDGSSAVPGSTVLEKLKSVAQLGKKKGDAPLPDNASIDVDTVIQLRKGLREGQVREGRF